MGKKRSELTQEEIWDDSALVDSWNEAYEEYKYYHGLHARGEKVEAILDAYEDSEAVGNKATNDSRPPNAQLDATPSEEGEIEDEDQAPAISQTSTTRHARSMAQTQDVPKILAATAQTPAAGMFDVVATPTHDPAMKNLMMSWYWAGYYTGLHEGRREAGEQSKIELGAEGA